MIELMVALMLGLMLIGGAIQVFVSNRATYAFNEGFSRLQENGRFALDTLELSRAARGIPGLPLRRDASTTTSNTHDACRSTSKKGVFGYEADGTNPGANFRGRAPRIRRTRARGPTGTPALPAELVGSVIPGSDVLIVRHASTRRTRS